MSENTEAAYTIVEPSFQLFEPCTPENHLEFLEKCVRTCYKSEDHIKPGSAQKLMEKVVNKFGHHSVIEHCNVGVKLDSRSPEAKEALRLLVHYSPLFAYSITSDVRSPDCNTYISGNLRLWRHVDCMVKLEGDNKVLNNMFVALSQAYPFFFEPRTPSPDGPVVTIFDTNPITNEDQLSRQLLLKHTTLTGKFIGSRTMSHQLVRHRLAAYSQESQRYCNYGKKGFQLIVPPTFTDLGPRGSRTDRQSFIDACAEAYDQYLGYLSANIPPEDARAVLPNATKTEVVATYSLEMWEHLFAHRGHNDKAQWEIKELVLEAERQIWTATKFCVSEYGSDAQL